MTLSKKVSKSLVQTQSSSLSGALSCTTPQHRTYCPAPRKPAFREKRTFKVTKKRDLFVDDLSGWKKERRGAVKELNRSLANATIWMSQAASILQKSPLYNSEADKMIEKYDKVQDQMQHLRDNKKSELQFLYPMVRQLPGLTFGWPIVKYAIRQKQMDNLMSQYYKNGELFNAMVAKNRNTFTL